MCDLVCMGVHLWEHEFPSKCMRLNPFLHLPFVLNLALSSHPGLVLSEARTERLCFQDADFGDGGVRGRQYPSYSLCYPEPPHLRLDPKPQ